MYFAPWGGFAGLGAAWMVYPALGEEKQANFWFFMTLGMGGKNPFADSDK